MVGSPSSCSSHDNTNTTAWICELHPRLELVSIPGSGFGYRVISGGGSIQKGEVLLTEKAFCSGKLSANSADGAIVSQFIAQIRTNSHIDSYKGNLSVAALTTATAASSETATLGDDNTNGTSGSPLLPQYTKNTLCHDRAWVQTCLDNNMYQCRREPRYAALFVALSRFNHSCVPNAINDASRDVARVRAVQTINEGEQVNISYVPVGHDLAHRTKALDSFGFNCACIRCVRERACDPSYGTKCDECGMGTIAMQMVADNNDMDDAPFSLASVATPCLACGSCSVSMGTDGVVERHAAVTAANTALQQYNAATSCVLLDEKLAAATADKHDADRRRVLQQLAETALLLAPFATHMDTIQLHRGLVRLLTQTKHQRSTRTSNSSTVMLEQLREIQRLEQAHGGAKHRDLNFLRCFARIVKRCHSTVALQQKGCCEDADDGVLPMLQKHVEAQWANLCLLHFGEHIAPVTFMAETDDDEVVVQYVPIGCGGEQLALFNADNEIDLSAHEIGDAGCAVLCTALSEVSSLCVLDLDSNGLSSVGGTALGVALAAGAAPRLAHLDLMCNSIGSTGACALAAALETSNCSLLTYLDLHGNAIGDDGCAALGAAFSVGAGARLVHLNLSTNGIDDRGCAALSSLFGGGYRMLAHLDLSENMIESCSSLFGDSNEDEGREDVVASALKYLNVSWNCIADFEPLKTVLIRTRCCITLVNLRVEGNMLSDRECNRFCSTLKASGATPMLECEEDEGDAAELACEKDDDDELCLQQCLRSLADGETINPRVCAEDIWQNKGATTIVCTAATSSAQDPSRSNSHLQDLLERDGFFVVPRLFPKWHSGGAGIEYSMDALASTMDRLDLAGWPPVFCFMCDAVWDLVSTRLWDEMRALLGDDCVLEPSIFAWSLKPPVPSNSNGQIGQSFGLPHRDYPASEALHNDGKTPKLLNVWIPVNDATLENGCMYIVPREFDVNFARSEEQAHMRSATTVRGAGVSKLRFALPGARALPARAGSLLSWCGNTIHWGASCSQYSASPPRKSIAMTFRRRSVTQLEGAGAPITQECARAMSLNMRLALISRSLLLYNQWHTLKGTAVPSVIYDVTSV